MDALLSLAADTLCGDPGYFPEGQECALPLGPGVYGGGDPLVLGPIEDIPAVLVPFLRGTIRAEGEMTTSSGELVGCAWVRVRVDHN